MMDWQKFLVDLIYPALASVITIFVSMLFGVIMDAIKRYASTLKHGQAFGIVTDAAKAAWGKKISPLVVKAMSDGKMTKEEWAEIEAAIKAEAKQIALERLTELRGFAPKDAARWVEVTLDTAMGELIGSAWIGGAPEEIQADTPASET